MQFSAIISFVERHTLPFLGLMMGVAAALWFWRGTGVAGPWIFSDEFIYWELGRNLAETGSPTIRDGEGGYYSLLVPLLAAPGHLLGDAEFAYSWIKAANPIVMALSALPAYAMARMALRPIYALLFTATVLALPGFAYTGSIMTEPVFLPIFLLAIWLLARALENPTYLRQTLAISAILLGVGVRLQAIALFGAMAIAVGFVILRGTALSPGISGLRLRTIRMLPMLVFAVGVPALALISQRLIASNDRKLLGGYESANASLGASEVSEWGLRHLGVTILAIAVLPAIFALAAWAQVAWRRFDCTPSSAILVASFAALPPMAVLVTVFAANNAARVQERNLFYVEPLIILAGMAGIVRWRQTWWLIAPSVALVSWLVLRLPLDQLLAQPPLANTFTLYGLWDGAVDFRTSPFGLTAAVTVVAGLIAIAALFLRKEFVLVGMPIAIAAFMVAVSWQLSPVINGYSERLTAASIPAERDWIQESAPGDDPVGLVWSSSTPQSLAWDHEIFNERIETVLAVGAVPLPGSVNHAQIDNETGRLAPVNEQVVLPAERLVVASADLKLAGRAIAGSPYQGGEMVLYEPLRPLRVTDVGIGYAADGWANPRTLDRVYDCRGGTWIWNVKNGFTSKPQTIEISSSGGAKQTVTLAPGEDRDLTIATQPDPATGSCSLDMSATNISTHAEQTGSGDPREVGFQGRAATFSAG